MIFDNQDNSIITQHDLKKLRAAVSGRFHSKSEQDSLQKGILDMPNQNVSDNQFVGLMGSYELNCRSILMHKHNHTNISHIKADNILLYDTTITHTSGWPSIKAKEMWVGCYNPGLLDIEGEVGDLFITDSTTAPRTKSMSTLRFQNLFICVRFNKHEFIRLKNKKGIKDLFQSTYAINLKDCINIIVAFKNDRYDATRLVYDPQLCDYGYEPISNNPYIQYKFQLFRKRL